MTGSARLWAAATDLAAPALRAMLRRRAVRGREIVGRLAEREGIESAPRPAGRLLWLHAASVGEALSAFPVVSALDAGIKVLFTTGTVTSAALVAQRLPELGSAGRVFHRFVPLDVPAWAARFLDHWRPDAACFVESELWPNLLGGCRVRRIPAALINARLSVRSAARWCNLPGLAREVLGSFAFIAAQSEADARRLESLGGGTVVAWGNLKDSAPALPADPEAVAALRAALGDRPRWLAASTHPGDEALVAGVHTRLAAKFPGLVTAIVPRHPERGAAIATELAAEFGAVAQRSTGAPPGDGLWIADTLGELGVLYRAFPAVFMGKSFAVPGRPGGGQNPLEAARLGCALAIGPDHGNFADAVHTLASAGGLQVVANGAALGDWVADMLGDAERLAAVGAAASAASHGDQDLPGRIARRLTELMARRPAELVD